MLYPMDWQHHGKFVGYQSGNMYSGILSKKELGLSAVTIGSFDSYGRAHGPGIKLQNNNIAFCGNFVEGKYSGSNLYIG